MENNNIQKINSLGKVIKILSKISMILCIIGAVIAMIAGGVVAGLGDDLLTIEGIADASLSIDIKKIPLISDRLDIDEKVIESKKTIEIEDNIFLDIISVEKDGDVYTLNVKGDLSEIDINKGIRDTVVKTFLVALVLIATAITLGFATKLAEAIEKCSSPFGADIIKKMKAFGFSLIAPAALGGIANGSFLTMAILAIAVIVMVYIFSYGAQLQQEADDTV